ncbi:helix-turn-helix transcriptional regulator [Neobacillus niacini]|uniref:helix-turn-helix domain-containing protein n=1 Tax=Neobacillus niacini TaxID=86668 RepID=UPI003002FD8D
MTETKIHYIGNGLRRIRKERGWTQEVLAAKCELETRTIQKLERNENSPTFNTIVYLADSFEMQDWEFLKNITDEIISKVPEKKERAQE